MQWISEYFSGGARTHPRGWNVAAESSDNWQPNPVRVSAFGYCGIVQAFPVQGIWDPASWFQESPTPQEAVAFNGPRGCEWAWGRTSFGPLLATFLSNGQLCGWQQMRICGMECIWAPRRNFHKPSFSQRRSFLLSHSFFTAFPWLVSLGRWHPRRWRFIHLKGFHLTRRIHLFREMGSRCTNAWTWVKFSEETTK